MPLSLGLIGYGHFGAFLHVMAQRYLPDAPLKIHSARRKPDGVLFFPLEEVAACDAVVLAVPISAYPDTLARIGPHLGSGAANTRRWSSRTAALPPKTDFVQGPDE